MSTFSCPIIQIQGHGKHKNADSLRITQVEGCTAIFKEGAFEKGDLAVFIPVDAVVPLDHVAFSWLKDPSRPNKKTHRTKAKRLRGIFSDGFLVPLTEAIPGCTGYTHMPGKDVLIANVNSKCQGFDDALNEIDHVEYRLGEDLSVLLGITKYEEPEPVHMNTGNEKDPGFMPVYDMESFKKFKHVLGEGEDIVITEKIHGCNARFAYKEGRLWVGSHRTVKAPSDTNLWWVIAKEQGLEEKLAKVEDVVLYGEVYGDVQDLKYGAKAGERRFAAFDAWDVRERKFLDYANFVHLCDTLGIPRVPELYRGPYSREIVESFVNPVEGQDPLKSTLAGCIREGVVIKPARERWNYETHRTILKLVSEAYLLRKGGSELH